MLVLKVQSTNQVQFTERAYTPPQRILLVSFADDCSRIGAGADTDKLCDELNQYLYGLDTYDIKQDRSQCRRNNQRPQFSHLGRGRYIHTYAAQYHP